MNFDLTIVMDGDGNFKHILTKTREFDLYYLVFEIRIIYLRNSSPTAIWSKRLTVCSSVQPEQLDVKRQRRPSNSKSSTVFQK